MSGFRPRITGPTGRNVGHLLSSSLHTTTPLGRLRASASPATLWLSGALLVGGVAVGLLLSTQWQPQSIGATASSPVTRQSGREIVISTIGRLEAEQADLKKQIADLRARLNEAQAVEAEQKTSLLDINKQIGEQRMAAGMIALHGPGVVATFDDSAARSVPENEDPENYILHDYDLRDILNTLWAAGAEAISLNGERIVSNSSLYCVGTTVICNATRISPPYAVRAIGEPEALRAALTGSPQMAKFNQRAQIYDLPVNVELSQDVQVPAYNGSLVFKYATTP